MIQVVVLFDLSLTPPNKFHTTHQPPHVPETLMRSQSLTSALRKHLPSLLGTSLAFLRSESPTQLRVAKFLQATDRPNATLRWPVACDRLGVGPGLVSTLITPNSWGNL